MKTTKSCFFLRHIWQSTVVVQTCSSACIFHFWFIHRSLLDRRHNISPSRCLVHYQLRCCVMYCTIGCILKLLLLDSIDCVQVVLILCWCFKKPIASRSSNSCFLLILIKWRYWSNSFHSNSSNIFLVVTTTICNGIFLHIIAEIGNRPG